MTGRDQRNRPAEEGPKRSDLDTNLGGGSAESCGAKILTEAQRKSHDELTQTLGARHPSEGRAYDAVRALHAAGYAPEMIFSDVIKISAEAAVRFAETSDLLKDNAPPRLCAAVMRAVPELRVLAAPLFLNERPDKAPLKLAELDGRIAAELQKLDRDVGRLLGAPHGPFEAGFIRRCAQAIGPKFSHMPEELKRGILRGHLGFDDVSALAPDADTEIFRRALNYLDWMCVDGDVESRRVGEFIASAAKSASQQPAITALLISRLFEAEEPRGHWNLCRVILNSDTTHRDWGQKGPEMFKSMKSFASDGAIPAIFVDAASLKLTHPRDAYSHLLRRIKEEERPAQIMQLAPLIQKAASLIERDSDLSSGG